MLSIDLNCDMGESFGAWRMGSDAEIMPFVSSINIACGFHAGDASTIRETIEMGIQSGVAIGAHPSFPDLQGFGRRSMAITGRECSDIVLYQIAALDGICRALGGKLHHVKPHGALYNQAANDVELAEAIAKAVKALDKDLILYGLSGSRILSEGKKYGLRTASEVFADRTYQDDGSLTPRQRPNALITDSDKAIAQILQMAFDGSVTSLNGNAVDIKPDTICIHGDGKMAAQFARQIHEALSNRGIEIKPPG